MLSRTLLVFLFLSVCSAGSSLSCRWLDHKFRQHSESSLNLLDMMVTNSGVRHTVAFPDELYSQASNAAAEDKLGFIVQVLEETVALFEEDHSSASWEENTVENFLNVVTQQADGLRSCIWSHGHKKNKKLHMYFKRLSRPFMSSIKCAEAWELIRTQIQTHLMRADLLASSLLNIN
ncbi:hypothetical protein L3Q82_010588 [Scortum barcoo]|uniref:Uncharacterized protein n=1 Tax=Scortum barcoo TaxID=214431 RepID=A0ACB8WFM3_9TELE|nr:hypothetical protein L3Q82_010588 [Scortum barcoo]